MNRYKVTFQVTGEIDHYVTARDIDVAICEAREYVEKEMPLTEMPHCVDLVAAVQTE